MLSTRSFMDLGLGGFLASRLEYLNLQMRTMESRKFLHSEMLQKVPVRRNREIHFA